MRLGHRHTEWLDVLGEAVALYARGREVIEDDESENIDKAYGALLMKQSERELSMLSEGDA